MLLEPRQPCDGRCRQFRLLQPQLRGSRLWAIAQAYAEPATSHNDLASAVQRAQSPNRYPRPPQALYWTSLRTLSQPHKGTCIRPSLSLQWVTTLVGGWHNIPCQAPDGSRWSWQCAQRLPPWRPIGPCGPMTAACQSRPDVPLACGRWTGCPEESASGHVPPSDHRP